ncbi:hypothetical protein [Terrabacter terrigena]|uniref:Uncharacterized protein n=1 Tax=Terrabacter terrigena TaxID=574718 RepID=A0ABW3MVK1_9MICO
MASLLGWDDAPIAAEVQAYGDRVLAERESQTQVEDLAADTARRAAAACGCVSSATGRFSHR